MNFLLSAGEASGDTYGAQLIDALAALAPNATFFGMGGEKMRGSGAELLVHANEVAVVGLVEVVRHLPNIRRRFKHLVAEAACRHPDRLPRLQPAAGARTASPGHSGLLLRQPADMGVAHGTGAANQEICPQDDCDISF